MNPKPDDVDVAIIGSGPVGLAMASALAATRLRIAVIEAGGLRQSPEEEKESLAATMKSPPAHPDAYLFRRRVLGGSSTVWGGRCLPFDRIDMEPLADRPGWPIGYDDVQPFMPRALDFLDAGDPVFDESAFPAPMLMNREGSTLDLDFIERFSKPTNLWKKTGSDLAARDNVVIHRNTLVRELVVEPESGRIRELDIVGTQSGLASRLRARHVVLAGGGIENARLLLSSRSVLPAGAGNQHDNVGRYYMTHLIGDVGALTLSASINQAKFDYRLTPDGTYARTLMKLSESLRASEGLPGATWRPNIAPIWDAGHRSPVLSAMHFAKSLVAREYAYRLSVQGGGRPDGKRSAHPATAHLLNILRSPLELAAFGQNWVRRRILADRKLPSVFLLTANRTYPMEINAEQFPDRQSRIGLSDRVDRYGMPLITLDWRPGERTLDGLARSARHFADAVEEAGVGEYLYSPSEIETGFVPQGGHHIGTTRMASDPRDGVVDRNCTVFGIPNLHVAGASVFVTSGYANPTLMAVALAFRLAEHLRREAAP